MVFFFGNRYLISEGILHRKPPRSVFQFTPTQNVDFSPPSSHFGRLPCEGSIIPRPLPPCVTQGGLAPLGARIIRPAPLLRAIFVAVVRIGCVDGFSSTFLVAAASASQPSSKSSGPVCSASDTDGSDGKPSDVTPTSINNQFTKLAYDVTRKTIITVVIVVSIRVRRLVYQVLRLVCRLQFYLNTTPNGFEPIENS